MRISFITASSNSDCKTFLHELGHEVHSAVDVATCLADETIDTPDLIMATWTLPVASGLKDFARLHAHFKGVPIVALVDSPPDLEVQVALDHGICAYLRTPFSKSEMGLLLTQIETQKTNDPSAKVDLAKACRPYLNTVIGYTTQLYEEVQNAGLDGFRLDLDRILQASKHLLELTDETWKEPQAEVATAVQKALDKTGGTTVLVIDSDRISRELTVRFLATQAYFVQTASHAEEAFATIRSQRPDIIILDIGKPDLDGWAVLTQLKSDAQMADIPVVLTAVDGVQNQGYVLGATDHLSKPIDRNQLLSAVKKYTYAEEPIVLVVEDERATRRVITRLMEKEGWQVVEASNGLVALSLLDCHQPNLILLDLQMPEMDGFEFLSHLRKNDVHAHIPVLVLTAKNITLEERKELTEKVARIMKKEISSTENLLKQIDSLVALSTSKDSS